MHNERIEERKQHLRQLDSLMKQQPAAGDARKAPPNCRHCPYYQPDFKYRTCLYSRCEFYENVNVFRKRPRESDFQGLPKVVRLDV